MKQRSSIVFLVACVLMTTSAFAQKQIPKKYPSKKVKSKDWEQLLDEDLTKWEVWTGVPDNSVANIPASYKKDANGDNKAPIGLGDPLDIYTLTKDADGEYVLNISGLVYAGLTSKKSYSNYHLTLLFKWGEKKYAPRLDKLRDNGLLYHCYGDHGAFWDVWKSCLESQIQEGDFGDLFTLAGTKAKVKTNSNKRWDPVNGEVSTGGKRSVDTESPHGEWTRVDLYVFGDKAIHVTNGKVVLALWDAKDHKGNKLDAGQIQIQSEGAEAYVKDICIRPISKFPKKILKASGL
ncbi:3-keto-disaccharide hydrolase [Saccharicrinis aurantiacus]|uniref:3-keto-disaccharide hydrolase n=1 Tax=Saccharicrinis aurantiacus TaxID=1849719 RepID=UPI0024926388|nr:DUF1080 domain-containing protein [Saccharicrinis aurantiacus]